VNREVHAEAILRAGADDSFVDQRVAHALHLRPGSPSALAEDGGLLAGGGAVGSDYRQRVAAACIWPSLVSMVMGTSRTMELTLNPARALGA
jgi:hypothetical protein